MDFIMVNGYGDLRDRASGNLNVTRELHDFISMPPKSLTFKRALSLLHIDGPFICASCRHRQAFSNSYGSAKTQVFQSRRRQHVGRKASTIASVTAVNAQRNIPPTFQALHESLSALEDEAAVYINLSQLKLVLRGLESENAVTRVAGMARKSIFCTEVTIC